MSRVELFTAVERSEDAAQRDMRIRGMRLAAYVAHRDQCAWHYDENLGEWYLVPVYDGWVKG